MHPIVYLMAQRSELVRVKRLGIGAGLDAPGITA
jgi:hypothetical protein